MSKQKPEIVLDQLPIREQDKLTLHTIGLMAAVGLVDAVSIRSMYRMETSLVRLLSKQGSRTII